MDNYIQTLNADLARMEELMKSLLVTPSDFETFLSLYLLYKEHQHTNTLIDYAEAVLKSGEGIEQLLAEATELNQLVTKCNRLYTDNQEAFDSIDNDALFEAHIKPFRDAEKAEADIAAPLWKEYQRLSNRLDYLAGDSDEFKEIEVKCDAVKAEYDLHHAKVEELHTAWRNEVKRCSAALTFKIEDLSLVFIYMQRISKSIIDTVTKAKGE